MKRILLGCVLLGLVAAATDVLAVPVAINFDNPNQTVAAPPSGSMTVVITGTVTIDPGYQHIGVAFFSPTNFAHTLSLNIATSAAFDSWFFGNPNGTFTGAILEITVPAGTPADFYGYETSSNNLAMFGIGVQPVTGGQSTSAEQAYSVTVTNGEIVPDNDVTLLLLAVAAALLYFARRVFVLKAWPTTG